jgi:hypothetical protein
MYIGLTAIFIGIMLGGVPSLLAQARDVQSGYLGLTADDSPLGRGAVVTRVIEGSPASKAGIQPGDTILAIDQRIVDDVRAMVTAMQSRPAGQVVKVDFLRKNRLHRVEVTLGVRSATTPSPAPRLPRRPISQPGDLTAQMIGLKLVNLKPTARNPGGVRVADVLFNATGVSPRIPVDSIIRELDRVAVKTREDCERVLGRHRVGDRVQVTFIVGNLVQETVVTLRDPQVRPPDVVELGSGSFERQFGEGGRRPFLGRLGRVLDGALGDSLPSRVPSPTPLPVEDLRPPNESPLPPPVDLVPPHENSTVQLVNEMRALRILVEALLDRVEQLEEDRKTTTKK